MNYRKAEEIKCGLVIIGMFVTFVWYLFNVMGDFPPERSHKEAMLDKQVLQLYGEEK